MPDRKPTEPEVAPHRFYIPATSSLLERRPRILKHGETFAVFDHYGDIVSMGNGPEGIYHADTRFLSHFQLRLNGLQPLLLGSGIDDENAVLTIDLTNPDITSDSELLMRRDTLHVFRSKFLWDGACYEHVRIDNFSGEQQVFTVSFHFDADFADLFEVRGRRREKRGELHRHPDPPSTVRMVYRSLDGIDYTTTLEFDPAPTHLEATEASFDLHLEAKERTSLLVGVFCTPKEKELPLKRAWTNNRQQARRHLQAARDRACFIDSSNELFNAWVRRSATDFYMLLTDMPEGPYPFAGIPWFSTVFGRDALIAGLQTLWIDPSVSKGVLGHLAATQATEVRPVSDAEPGKILHESRQGEMARLGEIPFGKYYGSVDATPLFVVLAGAYHKRTGDTDFIRRIWPNVEAALTWINTYGDVDGDGFVEYQRRSESGLDNQGWKDSHDSIFHRDGALAGGPIALCEVQGYVYAAKLNAADIAQALGMDDQAADLRGQAEVLRARFEEAFWCDDLSTYALALDGDKQPCEVHTSNAGHVLYSGIADPDRAARTADTLLNHESFSGWGIRTVATGPRRYNPMSYHNGSVWPHDNALIAEGFARYGLKEHVVRVFQGMFDTANRMDLFRLPELFCGFHRRPGQGPTFYPVACMPQAWASATIFSLIKSSLGLEFDHANGRILLHQPVLPDFLDDLRIDRLGIAGGEVDVILRRHGREVRLDVVDQRGEAEIIVVE